MPNRLAVPFVATSILLVGCRDGRSEATGGYLFGLTERQIERGVTTYAPDVALDIALAQLQPPFECWKFGDLCATVGPESAPTIAETLWMGVIEEMDEPDLLAQVDDVYLGAQESWRGDFFLTPEEELAYDHLFGIDFRATGDCGGVDNIERSPATGGDYVRSRSGVTNLLLYVSTWANGEGYDNNVNINTNVCVDGTGCAYIPGTPPDTQFLTYDLKCKVDKKVTVNANWLNGGAYSSFGSEGCASALGFTACSCRPHSY